MTRSSGTDGGSDRANGHHESWTRADDVDAPSERSFGWTFAIVFAVLAALTAWRNGPTTLAISLAAVAAGFWAITHLAPAILRPLNLVWFRFGLLLHSVVNPVILGLLFFLLFTPTGVIMRMTGKDFLGLRRRGATYWNKRDSGQDDRSSMINQF